MQNVCFVFEIQDEGGESVHCSRSACLGFRRCHRGAIQRPRCRVRTDNGQRSEALHKVLAVGVCEHQHDGEAGETLHEDPVGTVALRRGNRGAERAPEAVAYGADEEARIAYSPPF